MHFSTDDTIAAIASARGGALRGILRVSGPQAAECVDRCVSLDQSEVVASGTASRLVDVQRACVLPARWRLGDGPPELPGELYWWPNERSYTRQPTVEFHTIGSPPLLELALATVCAAGARLARPGEFTLRAFLAGRLDLTQAEAVLGVIDAVGSHDLDAALRQLAGGLTAPLKALRDRLLDLLAHVEAGLDFVTEDIEFISADELRRELNIAAAAVAELAGRMTSRHQSSDEPLVVLVGRPNAGKSSLFNALCGEAAALVANQPGTTRDYVERRVVWQGVACRLIDTAGLESYDDRPSAAATANLPSSVDDIEASAQRHSTRQRQEASVELFCLDASRSPDDWERVQLQQPPQAGSARLTLLTKIDMADALANDARNAKIDLSAAIRTSSRTGAGLDEVRRAVVTALQARLSAAEGVVAATAVRCRESLRRAAECLDRAAALVETTQEELVAAEVRLALEDLGEVAGAVYTDDVLDRIFSRFCIGK